MRRGWKKRAGVSLALFSSAVLLAAAIGGPVAVGAVLVLGLPALAWWNDNDLGYCLPLAVLFLLALAIIVLVFAMALEIHR
jgi:hypothetical protein